MIDKLINPSLSIMKCAVFVRAVSSARHFGCRDSRNMLKSCHQPLTKNCRLEYCQRMGYDQSYVLIFLSVGKSVQSQSH
jgi:hypothetical protein